MKTFYLVQPYLVRRHKLVASGAMVFEEAGDALSSGARTARFRPGVVVMSQVVDGRTGHMARPEVMAIHGRVPAAWRAAEGGRAVA